MPDLITALVPVLGRNLEPEFNVFDVMHHGTHEKQLSNVFAWLLRDVETHNLGSAFQRIFIEQINRRLPEHQQLPATRYAVLTEQNTVPDVASRADIADIVLVRENAAIVIENFLTSDGHGHSYRRYLQFAQQGDRTGVVVLLCQRYEQAAQKTGWENAVVVTYRELLSALWVKITEDAGYQKENPAAYLFIEQMWKKFAEGGAPVNENSTIDFLVAMCKSGEAGRYQRLNQEAAAQELANDIANQAIERFAESREFLNQLKQSLRDYCREYVAPLLDAKYGPGFVLRTVANYQGIHQWSVIMYTRPPSESTLDEGLEPRLQIRFGPSAWFNNERNPSWPEPVEAPNYGMLFVMADSPRVIRQTNISIAEASAGLDSSDERLFNELDALLASTPPEGSDELESPSRYFGRRR